MLQGFFVLWLTLSLSNTFQQNQNTSVLIVIIVRRITANIAKQRRLFLQNIIEFCIKGSGKGNLRSFKVI